MVIWMFLDKQMRRKKIILVVVACPDRGAGNDPEALGLAFHQGLSFINAYCQAAAEPG